MKLDSMYVDYFPEYSRYWGNHWYYWSICMEWLTMESYLPMTLHIGWLMNKASKNINARCIYIIGMHQIEQKLLFYIMLMIVYIGIHLRLLENGLCTLSGRYSMWQSWYFHIGLCQSGFHSSGTIPFQ